MTLLCFALVSLLGIGLVRWMFPAPFRWSLHNLLVVSLGVGAGIGIASSLYFVSLALFGPKLLVFAAVEGTALAAALVLGILVKRRSPEFQWETDAQPTPWYLTAAAGVALVSAITMFLFYAFTKPHGEWDAWSIWNMRARFLFRGGEFWRDAFSSQLPWTHPDYPLLIPGIVAMCWTLIRSESTLAPMTVAFLFTFGLAGILIATLGILRGKTQALIAGIVLLGSVSMIVNGANQYADIPLSYFILATVGLLCLQERYPDDLRFSILAGLTAGLAGWTKNEGLLFLVAVIAARAWAMVRYGDRTALTKQLLRFAIGLAGPVAVIAFFKIRFPAPNDLLARKPQQIIDHLADIGRWIYALEAYVKAAFRLGNFLIPVVLVLALYWYLVRFKVEPRNRAALATALLALGLTAVGEFLIYIALPGDEVWQINTSLERLLLQLWPSGLLAFFLAMNLPQFAAKGKGSERTKPVKRAPRQSRTASRI